MFAGLFAAVSLSPLVLWKDWYSTSEEHSDCVPAHAHVLRCGEDEDFERGIEGVDAMVE